jgi:hypothetical protein
VLPRVGVWHAELELEDDSVQDGAVELAWWDQQLSLKGTVRYGGAEHGGSRIHVLGGAAGLTTPVQPKAYRNVTRRLLVTELLQLANEKLSPRADQAWLAQQLPFWTLVKSTVGVSLTVLVELQEGISWRVLTDGSFWFGPEAWGAVDVDYEEIGRDPRAFRMDVTLDVPALQPGCTWLGQHISNVVYRVEERDLRATVTFEAPEP